MSKKKDEWSKSDQKHMIELTKLDIDVLCEIVQEKKDLLRDLEKELKKM